MIQIKNAKELDGMRRANALSAAALKYGGEHIEAGMTTWELDKLIYDFIVKHGGIPNFKGLYGFPGTACISLNDTVIHGIPSHDIVIRPGDIVSIDTGAKVDGFNGDNACTYAVGKVDLEAQRLLEVTKASLYKGIEQAVAGNRIGDIGYAVQSYCEDAGFSVVRDFVGHGTGKELHEDPEVPNYGHQGRGPRLVPGMTIAIEPMICQGDYKIKQLSDGWTVKTKDGGLAAHFEHSIAILKDRTEIMTRSWDDPDFDYMEEQDLALVVQSPSGTEDLLIELCGEFSVFFEKWHGEYAATAEGYAQLQQDITAILDGKEGALSLYTENGWQGTVLCTELPGAEDAAAALKRCWQAAKPDTALPAGSRLELVCWDPAQNRKVQLPEE